MIPKPAKLLNLLFCLLCLQLSGVFWIGGFKAGISVLTAVSVLWINLFPLECGCEGPHTPICIRHRLSVKCILFILKLLILSVGIFAMAMLLSPMYVFIANTIIVVSLIGVSLSTIYQSRLR